MDDYKRRAVFDDEIGRYAYAIDIHASKPSNELATHQGSMFHTMRYGKARIHEAFRSRNSRIV